MADDTIGADEIARKQFSTAFRGFDQSEVRAFLGQLAASLASLQEAGATMLLVEQDLGRALRVASRVVCMLEGRLVLEGAAGELSREQVTEAYFGLRTRREVSA